MAVGDLSALGAVAALARQLPSSVQLVAAIPKAGLVSLNPVEARPDAAVLESLIDDRGFPAVDWADLAAAVKKPASTIALWLGGERTSVAPLRKQAIATGVDPVRVTAQPYWAQGLTREEFDYELSGRYREAAEQGLDIRDPLVGVELELADS